MLKVLHHDTDLVAIEKPAGFHVHPPGIEGAFVSRNRNCLALLRNQIKTYLYPVHRLDCATSGILVYALNPDAAQKLSLQFSSQKVKKKYVALVRGYFPSLEGSIDRPLNRYEGEARAQAITDYRVLAQLELPLPDERHPTSRYSLVEALPRTGKFHQIRRHFAGAAHPLIGDTQHGDGFHNRRFREDFKLPGLFLRAHQMTFTHPTEEQPLQLVVEPSKIWKQILSRFEWNWLGPPL